MLKSSSAHRINRYEKNGQAVLSDEGAISNATRVATCDTCHIIEAIVHPPIYCIDAPQITEDYREGYTLYKTGKTQ